MPLYFFDFDDDEQHTRDEIGTDLPSLKAVMMEAIAVLPEIAKDRRPGGLHHLFQTSVRDESGAVIFVAKLEMDAYWTGGREPFGEAG